MLGTSFLKKQLLKRSRNAYNAGRFSNSRRRSRISYFIFRDRESLDILARSCLRTGRFEKSAKYYQVANVRGFALLDQDENHFKATLSSGMLIDAFAISQRIKGKENRRKCNNQLIRTLKSLNDTERVEIIQKMNEISPLPKGISDLLPWAPKKIEYTETKDNYTTLATGQLIQERYQREVSRIRSSGAYRLSLHLTEAVRKPMNILKLPFSFPKLIFRIIRERKGELSDETDRRFVVSTNSNSQRDCVVLFPTNGVGFGHFTRLLSIAREIRKSSPETEVVFFTTMPTLHILSDDGIICYHIPGRYRYKDMEASVWNALCEEMLSLIFSLHRPKCFIFDGAYPYRGMLNSIKSYSSGLLKIWVRRGSIKKDSKRIPVDSIRHFDAIIRPGDSVADDFSDETRHNVPIVRTNPILLENDVQNPNSLRKMMGIPEEATLCYVQLGAGKINEIDSELNLVLNSISEYSGIYVIVGESMIGDRLQISQDRVRILRDYPNSRFFPEFDFAIIAGGYNSYHEVINATLPSICFPNMSTGRDDQLARVSVASEKGAMIVLKKRNEKNVRLAISRMLEIQTRREMEIRLSELRSSNGSEEASNWIISQISD